MLYRFDFADPIAVELEQGIPQIFEDLTPGKLAIRIEKNELPAFVRNNSIDFSNGVGFGSITLSIDGKEAFKELAARVQSESLNDLAIEGKVIIEVQDTSLGGKKGVFEVNFKVAYQGDSVSEENSEKDEIAF